MAEKLRPYIPTPRPVTGDGFPYYVDQELRKLATFTEQSKKVLELTEQSITGDSASLLTVASAQSASGTSLATEITQLESSVTTAVNTANTASANVATLTTNVQALSTTTSSQATSITNLTSSVSTNTTNIQGLSTGQSSLTNNVATLTNDLTTLSNDVTTLSSDVSTLTTTVGGFSSSITTNTNSINGISSNYSVRINNNGHISGFGLISTGTPQPVSEFVVQADKFKIETTGTNSTTPFSVIGGNVFIDQATIGQLNASQLSLDGQTVTNVGGVLKVGTIGGANIDGGAISGPKIGTNAVSTDKVLVDNITETDYAFTDSGASSTYNYNIPYIQAGSFDIIVHAPCTILIYAIMDFAGSIGSGTYARFGQWIVPNTSSLYSFTTLPSGGSGYTSANPTQFVRTAGYASASHQQLVYHLDLTGMSTSLFPYTVKQKVAGYELNWTGFRMVTNHVAIVSYR